MYLKNFNQPDLPMGTSTSGEGPQITESLAYNPNQEAKLSLKVPLPEGWGTNEMNAEVITCQETVRQMYGAAVNRLNERTSTLDSAGIHTVSVSKAGVTVGAQEGIETPTAPAPSTPGESGDTAESAEFTTAENAGAPTSMEDRVVESIEHSFEQLKNLLKTLDLKVTVQRREEGSTFHIFNGSEETGVATSAEETEVPFDLLPQTRVNFKGLEMQYSDQNMARLFRESGGEPMTVATIGPMGKPTADESGVATVNTQSKNELEQIGLINSFLGFQLAISLGPIVNIQTNV